MCVLPRRIAVGVPFGGDATVYTRRLHWKADRRPARTAVTDDTRLGRETIPRCVSDEGVIK